MASTLARSRASIRFFAREASAADWILIAIGVLGWLAMGSMVMPAWLALCVGSSGPLAHLHAELGAASQSGLFAAISFHWLLMIAAMMTPLLLEPVRHLSFRIMRARHASAIGHFLAAYALVWTAAGVPIAVTMLLWRTYALPPAFVAPMLVAAALAWQFSRKRRALLRQCHRMPALRGRGAAADRDSAVFGLRQGAYCVLTCGPAMLATMAVPIPFAGFLAGSLLLIERATLEASAKPLALLLAALGVAAIWQ